jgi:hypothetical protein
MAKRTNQQRLQKFQDELLDLVAEYTDLPYMDRSDILGRQIHCLRIMDENCSRENRETAKKQKARAAGAGK